MPEGSLTLPATVPNAPAQPDPAKGTVTENGGTTRIVVDTSTPPADKKVDPSRPAWLPEKFKSAEDMAAAYSELEKKQGSAGDKKTVVTPDPTKVFSDADMSALNTEFAKDGKLSDETYKSLAGKGFSKETVDQHIAGTQALVEKYTAGIHEAVGGKENYDKLSEWAGANLNDAELASVNAVLGKGDPALSKITLEGLKARYDKVMGVDPSLVTSAPSANASGVQPFRSSREVTEAMGGKNAARYRNDPAYRKDIEKRLAVTEGFNA